jgi:uncharacterized protein
MSAKDGHNHPVDEAGFVAADATEQEQSFPAPRTLGARMLILPIVAYRRWISPALPARCRFYPSCSAYAVEAISTHGAVKGLGLATWRLLRCQPFNAGGYDPVPPRKN